MAGFKHFKEIGAWQHARELRRAVYALCRRECVQRDPAFRDQLLDAARGPARNVAEGFGRFRPREFSRFLKYASSSLNEVENHLEDGIDLRYWTRDEAATAFREESPTPGKEPGTEPKEPVEPVEPRELR